MDTATIVKEKTVNVLENYNAHNERVLRIIGKTDGIKLSTHSQIENLKAQGFQCFVKRDIEQKFQYKAGISGSYSELWGITDDGCIIFPIAGDVRNYIKKVINYVGDIPDFIMENYDKAKNCGIKNFMVYSCQPLPTEEILQKVDPVMIGWLDDNETGVVIGIWDRDKEITI